MLKVAGKQEMENQAKGWVFKVAGEKARMRVLAEICCKIAW